MQGSSRSQPAGRSADTVRYFVSRNVPTGMQRKSSCSDLATTQQLTSTSLGWPPRPAAPADCHCPVHISWKGSTAGCWKLTRSSNQDVGMHHNQHSSPCQLPQLQLGARTAQQPHRLSILTAALICNKPHTPTARSSCCTGCRPQHRPEPQLQQEAEQRRVTQHRLNLAAASAQLPELGVARVLLHVVHNALQCVKRLCVYLSAQQLQRACWITSTSSCASSAYEQVSDGGPVARV